MATETLRLKIVLRRVSFDQVDCIADDGRSASQMALLAHVMSLGSRAKEDTGIQLKFFQRHTICITTNQGTSSCSMPMINMSMILIGRFGAQMRTIEGELETNSAVKNRPTCCH